MSRIAEKAKFIGRRSEVNEIAELMELAVSGKGQIVFVNGEAGIGKTRFINEIQAFPIGQRFTWLTARCICQDGADPYLPFTTALKGWLNTPTNPALSSTTGIDKNSSIDYDLNDLKKIPILGPKLAEEPSMSFGSFMIKEPKSEFCLSVFSALIKQGRTGLGITRIPPNKLDHLSKESNANLYWLSSKPGELTIPPSLTKLSHTITEFLKNNPNSVIMIDGLEYLISHIEFNKVLRFVNELVDTMAIYKSILFIPMYPLTIDPKQLALLERNMNTIDINDLKTKAKVESEQDEEQLFEEQINGDDLQQGRNKMFENITQKILEIASIKPVALLIDDLHWADVGSLYLLHYLTVSAENNPLIIIGAYRPEDLAHFEKPHPLQELIDRLLPEKQLKLLTLNRFNKLETREIIESLLQNKEYPLEILDYIHEETEGNPFFIEEILRSLLEEKVLRYNENLNSWRLEREITEYELPDTIKDVVRSRINRLNKNSRLLIEIASVLGVEFDHVILSMVSKLDEEELVNDLNELINFKLITELPTKFGQSVRYKFAHNKVREVLYEGISHSHKRLLHAKTAVALEDIYINDLESMIYELAQHSYHGEDYSRVFKYALSAGNRSMNNFAPEKARTFYCWALDSIELIEAKSSIYESYKNIHTEIVSKLVEICTLIGEWDDALKYTEYLMDLSRKFNDIQKQTDAYNYAGRIHIHRSSWQEAIEQFKNALKLANESKYLQGMMEADNGLGEIHERTGEYDQALKFYEHFMDLAKTINSQNEIARGYKALAMVSTNRGEFNEALAFYQKCIDILSEIENYHELAKAYTNIGIPYFELGDFDKVIECNEKCIELANRTGDIRTKGLGYSNAAEVYARNHLFEKALDYANKALDIFKKLNDKPMIGLVWMNYGIIYKNKRDWDPSKYYFEKSLGLLKILNVPYYLADCTYQYALMLAGQDNQESLSESRKYLNQALEIFQELGSKKYINEIRSELDQLTQ